MDHCSTRRGFNNIDRARSLKEGWHNSSGTSWYQPKMATRMFGRREETKPSKASLHPSPRAPPNCWLALFGPPPTHDDLIWMRTSGDNAAFKGLYLTCAIVGLILRSASSHHIIRYCAARRVCEKWHF